MRVATRPDPSCRTVFSLLNRVAVVCHELVDVGLYDRAELAEVADQPGPLGVPVVLAVDAGVEGGVERDP